jgi:hypothetical protein
MERCDPRLAAYLEENDAPCPGCRYNLRGLADQVCPECGLHLNVRMLQGDVHLTIPWFVGLAPLLLIALSAIPLVAIGCAFGVSAALRGEWVGGAAAFGMAIGAVWGGMRELRWIRFAEVFVSRSRREQWERACVSWGVLAMLVILIIATGIASRAWS